MLKKFIRRTKPCWNKINNVDPLLAFREHDLGDFAVQTQDDAHPAIRCPDLGEWRYSRNSHGMPTEAFPRVKYHDDP